MYRPTDPEPFREPYADVRPEPRRVDDALSRRHLIERDRVRQSLLLRPERRATTDWGVAT